MRVFIVASDEPIFLVPYLRRVIQQCRPLIVGVGVHTPAPKTIRLRRMMALGLLALLVLSPRQWARLLYLKWRDALAGLGIRHTDHHLADVCREAGVPVRAVASVNAETFAQHLIEQRVDVLLHQTSEILRGPVLSAPAIAVVNRHLSLLPAYRGAWPIFWQVANGESEVGISLHVVDEGIDSGAVVVQEAIRRQPHESMSSLLGRLFERSVPLTCMAFETLRAGRPAPQPAASGPVYKTPTATQILRYLFTPRRETFGV